MRYQYILLIIATCLCFTNSHASDDLNQKWNKLKQEKPALHTRDAAKTLGVSEAQLLATQKDQVTLLKGDIDSLRKIMRKALDFGEVMALSRNENGVIETTGIAKRYQSPNKETLSEEDKLRQQNSVGGYIGGPIDLRLNFQNWAYAFAVTQNKNGKKVNSLQFFDAHGDAVHKIFLKNEEAHVLFEKTVEEFRLADQNNQLSIQQKNELPKEIADELVDLKEFHLAWSEMDDVHQFSRIVSEFKLTREQAFRLAPKGFSYKIPTESMELLLKNVADENISIMAFLGNKGITQIFSGTIQKVSSHGDWLNILDPKFNLHLRQSAITHGWIVNRAGLLSIDFYDQQGEQVVTFFGVRERGQAQPQKWLTLVEKIRTIKTLN